MDDIRYGNLNHEAEVEQVARGEQQVTDRQTRITLVANWD